MISDQAQTFQDRINVLIDRAGGPAELARKSGLSRRVIDKYRSGESEPSRERLIALSQAANVPVGWLATGEDDGFEEAGKSDRPQPPTVPGAGFVFIPRYDVEASAGTGTFNDDENVVDYMAFREDWVRRALRVDPKKLVLITAIGDSMEPAIRAGDLLLIDTGVERILDDAIYVLVKRGELIVKRVQQFFNGAVVIKSDNQAYVEETLGSDEARDLKVAGRVRWIGRLI